MKISPHSPARRIQDPLSSNSDLSSNQEQPDYTSNFQQTNQLFVLRSTINEANLTIQKMALQQEQQLLEERRFYSQMEAEKKQIEQRQETLVEEIRKLTTISEAERNAKNTYASKLRQLKQEMGCLKGALGFSEEAEILSLVEEIQNKQSKFSQMEEYLEAARRELSEVRKQKEQQSKLKISQIESNIKRLEDSYKQKIAEQEKKMQAQDQSIKALKEQLKESIQKAQQAGIKAHKLERVEMELAQISRRLEEECSISASKQRKIVDLKVKEELLTITKQKWQEDKISFNQQLEQLTFKLEITSRKLETHINRLKDEQKKSSQLETIIAQLKEKLQKNDCHRIQQEQSISCLQQELKVYKIYEQKFRKAQSTIEEQQTTIEYLTSNCEQYAGQVHHFQEEFKTTEYNKHQLEEAIHELRQQIESKDKQLTKSAYACNHHSQLLKQCKVQLAKCRAQLKEAQSQLTRKRSFIELPKIQNSEPPSRDEREQWQRMGEQIAEHYQQMLKMEDLNRQNLQSQLQNSNQNVLQLQSQVNQQNRQKNELTQQNRLLQQENERLTRTISTLQKNYDTKVSDLRIKYKDLEWNAQQNNSRASNGIKNKVMKIYCTLNFCHSYHGTNASQEKSYRQTRCNLHSCPSYPTELQRRQHFPIQSPATFKKPQKSQEDNKRSFEGQAQYKARNYQHPNLNIKTQSSQPSHPNLSALQRQIHDFQERNRNIRYRLNL